MKTLFVIVSDDHHRKLTQKPKTSDACSLQLGDMGVLVVAEGDQTGVEVATCATQIKSAIATVGLVCDRLLIFVHWRYLVRNAAADRIETGERADLAAQWTNGQTTRAWTFTHSVGAVALAAQALKNLEETWSKLREDLGQLAASIESSSAEDTMVLCAHETLKLFGPFNLDPRGGEPTLAELKARAREVVEAQLKDSDWQSSVGVILERINALSVEQWQSTLNQLHQCFEEILSNRKSGKKA